MSTATAIELIPVSNSTSNATAVRVTEWRGRTIDRSSAMLIIFAICAVASFLFIWIALFVGEPSEKRTKEALIAFGSFVAFGTATAVTACAESREEDEDPV
jgi:hypothetical protein